MSAPARGTYSGGFAWAMARDLRLAWRHEKKGITLTGFVENATNRQVLTRSVIFSAGEANVPTASIQANYNNPRTWGLKLGVDF